MSITITQGIKDFGDALVILTMNYLTIRYPFLKIPLLGSIMQFFVEKILNILISFPEFWAYSLSVLITVKHQESAFNDAVNANTQALLTGTDEEKKKAQQNLIDAARNFIRITQP